MSSNHIESNTATDSSNKQIIDVDFNQVMGAAESRGCLSRNTGMPDSLHEINKGTLPAIELIGNGIGTVSAHAVRDDLLQGMKDQIVHHPVRTLGDVATGLAGGVALTLAANAGGKWSKIAVLTGVAALGAYEIATGIKAAQVVESPKDYSAIQVAQAHDKLKALGADALETGLVVGVSGVAAGKIIGTLLNANHF